MRNLFKSLGLIILTVTMFTFTACGGGSSSGTSSGDSTGVTSIKSLSDIPLDVVDPSQYDKSLSTSSSSLSTMSLSTKQNPGAEGGFSRAGCEADQSRNRIVREAKFPKAIMCYMQKMGEELGMELGDASYSYYNIGEVPGGPDDLGGSMNMKVAAKKVGTEVTMLMCENDVKVMEFVISADPDAGLYSGHMIDNWSFDVGEGVTISEARQLDFEADGDADNFTSAQFTQSFDSDQWGFGSESLIAAPTNSTVYGYFSNSYGSDSFSGSTYAQFDSTQGTAKFSVSGTYRSPNGSCWDEEAEDVVAAQDSSCSFTDSGTESFTVSGTAPNQSFVVASSSDYAAEVAAATLPSAGSAPSIEFSSSEFSDCAPPAGSSWGTLSGTVAGIDMSECEAIEEELSDFQDESGCRELEDTEWEEESGSSGGEGWATIFGGTCDDDDDGPWTYTGLSNGLLGDGADPEDIECIIQYVYDEGDRDCITMASYADALVACGLDGEGGGGEMDSSCEGRSIVGNCGDLDEEECGNSYALVYDGGDPEADYDFRTCVWGDSGGSLACWTTGQYGDEYACNDASCGNSVCEANFGETADLCADDCS